MKADGSLVNLIQGVSQQPSRERLPGQCTLQENMTSNPVTGLGRRSPSQYIGDLYASDPGITQWSDFVASDGNHYVAAIRNGDLDLFDLDAGAQSITVNSSMAYLTGGPVSFETIDTETFVMDRAKVTALTATLPSYKLGAALVFLLGGQYGRIYSIALTFTDAGAVSHTVTVSYTTPNGSVATDITLVSTINIATQLETALNANGTVTATFTITRAGDVLCIAYTNTARTDLFTCAVNDGDGGANIFSVANQADSVGKLPRFAPHRFIAKITGDGDSGANDWYLQFLCKDNLGAFALGAGFGTDGVWRECTGPGQTNAWDTSTMPHALVMTSPGHWTWAQGSWAPRAAGDDLSNPPPSLLGRTINDIGTFQGRLVLTSGTSLIMSRTNKPFDLWLPSATVVSDDGVIDIQSTAGSFAVMKDIIPQNRDLVVFSDKAQFIVYGRTALTPKNSALVLTTSFEANLNASPAPAGRNVFFAIDYGQFTGIKEFYSEGVDDVNDSRPITQHVNKYILGKARKLAATSNFDTLAVLSEGVVNNAYVYEYLWVDDQKVQAAWSTWIFGDQLKHMFFEQNVLYGVFASSGGRIYLAKLALDRLDDDGVGYLVYLDNKQIFSGIHTSITSGYDLTGRTIVLVQGEGCPEPGMTAQGTISGTTVTLERDMLGGTVLMGERFLSRYQPTMPMVKDGNNVKVGTGRLRVKNFLISYVQTGYITALKWSKYAAQVVAAKFAGRIMGDPDNVVGEPALPTGTFKVPFRMDADIGTLELQTDSHMPMTFLDMEWTGQWTKRGKRILSNGGGASSGAG